MSIEVVRRLALASLMISFAFIARAAETPESTLSAGASVDFEIVDHLGSKVSKVGDHFRIKLVEPLRSAGEIVVPAGTMGEGEVIHAARARAGGKAGELIIAARSLDYAGQEIGLRSFRYGKSGDSNVTEGAVVAFVGGPLAYLVVGGEVDIPPGTRGNAKLKNDITIRTSTIN